MIMLLWEIQQKLITQKEKLLLLQLLNESLILPYATGFQIQWNYYFDYPNNSLIHPSEVTCYFKRICKKYRIDKGWDVNFHMLRHTFATRCIESGMSAKVLQKKLGHKKIATTLDTYTSVFAQFENQQDELFTDYLSKQDLLINL